ncbi:hypothetical protein SSX86_003457 [Deinandra increscens subsp. villosa]|uniref:Uncharacterized protein n=1 Tax=Deinandra increscens subsp. villosa TaxID=3103831 RepID=A0AAP0DM22_9ASTR
MNPSAYYDVTGVVVGDFMDPFVPTVAMNVYFGNHRLINSSELRLSLAQITPRVVIGGEHDGLYTLVMINPDAPNPNEPSLREFVVWIVTNISSGASSDLGTEFVPYDVPNPEVGVQRYVMLLYKQKSVLNRIEPLQSRACFKSCDFADQHNLGKPVGISYFYVRRQTRKNARA